MLSRAAALEKQMESQLSRQQAEKKEEKARGECIAHREHSTSTSSSQCSRDFFSPSSQLRAPLPALATLLCSRPQRFLVLVLQPAMAQMPLTDPHRI